MGRMQAQEMSGAELNGELDLEQVIAWHLRYNHYPAPSVAWIPVAVEFVKSWRAGERPEKVKSIFPDREAISADKFIEAFHLEDFLSEEEEECISKS